MQILTFHHSIRLTSVKHHFVHITSAYPHPNSRSHSHTQQNNSEMRKINFYKIYASVLICKILFFIWMKFFHNLMFKVNQHFLFEGFLPAPFQQSVHSNKLSAATATNPHGFLRPPTISPTETSLSYSAASPESVSWNALFAPSCNASCLSSA